MSHRSFQTAYRFAACLALTLCIFGGVGPQAQTPPQSVPTSPMQTNPIQQKTAQLAADSARLLKLATELKAAVDKSTKDQLSLTVVKKAGEVEKLARKVREEMKTTLAN